MTPEQLYNLLLSYGLREVEVSEFFRYAHITICDMSYDFKCALFDIDEGLYYDEIERAAEKTGGWGLAA